jgi:DNA-binding NtrC family response regulator
MKANIRNILVVDDEQEIRELLKFFLEDHGFNVTLAADGIQAAECIKNDIPGIVVIDLLLPGEHGINLIKSIKRDYFIPTVIISGVYRRDEIEPVMEEYFVEGFIEKPIDLNRLLTILNSIIDGRNV